MAPSSGRSPDTPGAAGKALPTLPTGRHCPYLPSQQDNNNPDKAAFCLRPPPHGRYGGRTKYPNMTSFRNDILPLKNQLYRLALRITLNSAEAEDIVQETMIKVWNRRETWNEIENIEAFCFTICRNLSLDSLKRHGNQHQSIDDSPVERPDNSRNPSDRTIQRDQLNLVRQIVDNLPEKQRSCIQLRDFEGKSYRDIARILQITEEQVKVNIFRGRQTIKLRFREMDSFGI